MSTDLLSVGGAIPEPSGNSDYGTWGETLNDTLEAFDRAAGQVASVATTGGTTTLTSAQNDCAVISVTGTLISNATVYVRARPRFWIVRNATAGAFTLTVRVVGDVGAAVTVAQGKSCIVLCNGTVCSSIDLSTLQGSVAVENATSIFPDFITVEGTTAEILLKATSAGDADFKITNTGDVFRIMVDSASDGSYETEALAIDSNTGTVSVFGFDVFSNAENLGGQPPSFYTAIAARLGYTPFNAASFTGANILAALLPVDGANSGLDADKVRGTNPGSTGLALLNASSTGSARAALGLGTYATINTADWFDTGTFFLASRTLRFSEGATNYDELWHDDSTDTWYLVSDGAASRQADPGVSTLVVNRLTAWDIVSIGSNGGGDSLILFFDDGANTQRTFGWDDSASRFVMEDDGGVLRTAIHTGNIGTYAVTDVGAATADLSRGALGSYGMMSNRSGSTITGNSIVAGSGLRFGVAQSGSDSGTPSGNWRHMGGSVNNDGASLFLRTN